MSPPLFSLSSTGIDSLSNSLSDMSKRKNKRFHYLELNRYNSKLINMAAFSKRLQQILGGGKHWAERRGSLWIQRQGTNDWLVLDRLTVTWAQQMSFPAKQTTDSICGCKLPGVNGVAIDTQNYSSEMTTWTPFAPVGFRSSKVGTFLPLPLTLPLSTSRLAF